jgi:hypothetical protein
MLINLWPWGKNSNELTLCNTKEDQAKHFDLGSEWNLNDRMQVQSIYITFDKVVDLQLTLHI